MSGGVDRKRRAAIMRGIDEHRFRAAMAGLCVLCGGPYERHERVIRAADYGPGWGVAHRRCAIKAAMESET